MATIEGAKVLNLENEIGSIEVGKKADLVLLDLENPSFSMSEDDESIYSNIVYSNSKGSIREVMIEGDWVVKGGESLSYIPEELCIDGKNELEKLLRRV